MRSRWGAGAGFDSPPGTFPDRRELTGYLRYFLTEVYDPDYSRLLASFFDDAQFLSHFCQAPAAQRSHHAYPGGLLEHTVSVATMCQHVTVQHPRLDADLLVTAALLHDIGKVSAFAFEEEIRLSPEGELQGHVLIGGRMIRRRIGELGGFPEGKALRLEHALISHHGELEWGALKRPDSAEALVLHHIDNLDARVNGFLETIKGGSGMPWPRVKNYFRRPLSEPLAADRE